MTAKKKDFLAQFDNAEERAEAKRDFIERYAYSMCYPETEDAIQDALDGFNDEWELHTPATRDDVAEWLEDEEAVRLACLQAEQAVRRENALQTFREQRQVGGTFMQAAKTSREDPAYLAHILATADDYEINPERLAILRDARIEDYKVRSFKARQKVYRIVSNKIESAMKEADFSKVAPEKLVDMMLKLSQITRDDEPPEMTVRIGLLQEV